MTKPRAADDFTTIRSRMEELEREKQVASGGTIVRGAVGYQIFHQHYSCSSNGGILASYNGQALLRNSSKQPYYLVTNAGKYSGVVTLQWLQTMLPLAAGQSVKIYYDKVEYV